MPLPMVMQAGHGDPRWPGPTAGAGWQWRPGEASPAVSGRLSWRIASNVRPWATADRL